MASQEVDPSTLVFFDPGWIATSGGYLHSNNVLFYFARSPFFDPLSANNTVFAQAVGNPQREQMHLSTRAKFEAELQNHVGVQYVVDSDPLLSQAKVKNPNGAQEASETWVIKKQQRKGLGREGEVLPLEYYYIVNQTVFQAPRADSILNYRLTNVTMALDKMINTVATLPKFSASTGYPYYTENQKSITKNAGAESHPSKAGTPMPDGTVPASQENSLALELTDQQSDDRTLTEALRMTMTFGTQYHDDAPLVGEPGNFRYAKTRDPVQLLKAAEAGNSVRSGVPSKGSRPSSSQSVKQSPGPATLNGTGSPH